MSGTNDLQATIDEAVASDRVPYIVAMLANSRGTLWQGVAGNSRPERQADLDMPFRIVSMSKAVGSTAALILAERGLLDWNMPVDEILPEFASLQILEHFDEAPHLRAPRVRATLRHLATHTSGLAYEFWDPMLGRYLQATKTPSVVSGTRKGLMYPLMFEPGKRWRYGGGIDWLGLVVAAIDGRSIDRFCKEEIFTPLGMTATVFEATDALKAGLGTVHARTEAGHFVSSGITLDPPLQPEFYGMGTALYSTAPDYLRFLRMWLGKGQLEGARILKEATVEEALKNQIGNLRLSGRPTAFPPATADLELLPGFQKTHSLAFARLEEDIPGGRRTGSQFWAGVLNTHFWLDPVSDLAGVYMTQCLPFLDAEVMKSFAAFERAAYAFWHNPEDK